MSLETVRKQLGANSKSAQEEVLRLLVKIADNILNDPKNNKIRHLKKNNTTISSKILGVTGGLECLKLMGFVESESSLVLPADAGLEKLKSIRDGLVEANQDEPKPHGEGEVIVASELDKFEVASSSSREEETPAKRILLPPLINEFSVPFLRKIELDYHRALVYEDSDLQERARKLIPINTLTRNAQQKLRTIQERIKAGKLSDPDISLQDLIILELLAWFKESFFSWVDSPPCQKCDGTTHMSHLNEDPKMFMYTDRIEMHICDSCQVLTPFPRYEDLNILLETRRGRCGEWANVFTLFGRSLGWDTRRVFDETDHVWTEVYSFAQKRWLHCDPCENVCDSPLIYETGWGKKLSYVIAYSSEEVQDVTWRYSSDHEGLLSRRTLCTESELIDALLKMRAKRQATLSEGRRAFLNRRLVQELAEMMVEKKPQDADKQGRVSGSLDWRLMRGEAQDDSSSYTWNITQGNDYGEPSIVRYSSTLDQYEFVCGRVLMEQRKGWHAGVFQSSGVFRKEEKDWKMVYLARNEGTEVGTIKWKFAVEDTRFLIDKVSVTLRHRLYENGQSDIVIHNDSESLVLEADYMETRAFSGSSSVVISVELKGGKGNVGWQHAQLFRESMEAHSYSFIVTFTFKTCD